MADGTERRSRCCRGRAAVGHHRRRHHRRAGPDDGHDRAALGLDAAVAGRNRRREHASSEGSSSKATSALTLEPDGKVVVRLIGAAVLVRAACIVVPAEMPVTFRGTATDAIHGFVVGPTNANTMLIPGFVATFTTSFKKPGEQLMPCHEYCGTGHEAMWARVQVLPAAGVPRQGTRRRKAELCSSLRSSSWRTSGSRSSRSSAPSCSANGRCSCAVRSRSGSTTPSTTTARSPRTAR